MATTITFNGNTYQIPSPGDKNWGSYTSTLLTGLAQGLIGVGGNNTFTGNNTFSGAVTATGGVTANALTVTGATALQGGVTITGPLNATGNLTSGYQTGAITPAGSAYLLAQAGDASGAFLNLYNSVRHWSFFNGYNGVLNLTDATSSTTRMTIDMAGNTTFYGTLLTTNGIKQTIGPFTYSTTSTPHGAFPALQVAVYVQPGNTVGGVPFKWVAPFAGSILAVSASNSVAIAATTGLFVLKNGIDVGFGAVTIIASSATQGIVTQPKGSFSFAAGDTLQLSIDYSVTGLTVTTTAHLLIEMAA